MEMSGAEINVNEAEILCVVQPGDESCTWGRGKLTLLALFQG